jgi:hypothetical protein
MKLILFSAILLFVFSIPSNAQTHLKLNDAVAKGFIKLKITGNDGHTGKCATVQTENTTSQTLDIDIDCGQKIQCNDTLAQNLVITQSEHVRLTAKRMIATAVFAMCINAHKASPGRISFKLGQMAQGALLRLTRFIEKKKYQNSQAQSAIWTITDNNSVASIGSDVGSDYEMTNELRGFVAKEKHVEYTTAKPAIRIQKNIEGTFDLILEKQAIVEVILVDASNKMVTQFVHSSRDAGIIRINYTLKNTDYKAGRYYIISRVANKEVKRELVMLE